MHPADFAVGEVKRNDGNYNDGNYGVKPRSKDGVKTAQLKRHIRAFSLGVGLYAALSVSASKLSSSSHFLSPIADGSQFYAEGSSLRSSLSANPS